VVVAEHQIGTGGRVNSRWLQAPATNAFILKINRLGSQISHSRFRDPTNWYASGTRCAKRRLPPPEARSCRSGIMQLYFLEKLSVRGIADVLPRPLKSEKYPKFACRPLARGQAGSGERPLINRGCSIGVSPESALDRVWASIGRQPAVSRPRFLPKSRSMPIAISGPDLRGGERLPSLYGDSQRRTVSGCTPMILASLAIDSSPP
jgi:hypothetical protein